MRAENFIYFATICGFFIGIVFSVFYGLDVYDFLFATMIITILFYMISLGSVAFYLKYVDIKKRIFFDVKAVDEIINMQVCELEKYENFIFESHKFIKEVEKEELEIIRKNRK